MDTTYRHNAGVETASAALNAGVIGYLRAVQDRGGDVALDAVATNLVTDVCAVLVREFGPERLFELFDSIEAMQVNPTQLAPLLSS
jgi:hypothetical protein